MKKQIFLLMIGAIVALASCSKSEEAPNLPQSGEQSATFQIEAPVTRAPVAGLTRYIVEAYESKDLTTTPVRVEAATGSLTLELKKNTEYTFVFWADKGTAKTESVASSGYWNTDNLQEVVVSAGKESTVGEVAYCLAVSFNSKDLGANKPVTLKNATAQLNFVEAAGLTAANNSLSVKYPSGGKLNVAAGTITEVTGEVSRTYSNIIQTAKDGIVATDYILAPLGEKRLLDLKVTFNTEAEKSITGVPFQQSYKTNVKGEFSNLYASVFIISNEVDDYENNDDVDVVPKPSVGNFFYFDKTFSSEYSNAKGCVGIVFYVNADGSGGKIVSLDQGKLPWSTAQSWKSSKSLPAGMTWNCPTLDELQYLYCAYSGIPPETWDGGKPSKEADVSAKAKFNALLDAANGTAITNYSYWSSKQDWQGEWFVSFLGGNTGCDYPTNDLRVRSVSTF